MQPNYKEAFSPQNRSSSMVLQNMTFVSLWVIFDLRDPDPNPHSQCWSGSTTLAKTLAELSWAGSYLDWSWMTPAFSDLDRLLSSLDLTWSGLVPSWTTWALFLSHYCWPEPKQLNSSSCFTWAGWVRPLSEQELLYKGAVATLHRVQVVDVQHASLNISQAFIKCKYWEKSGGTLIKKKIKFASFIRKFRVEQLIWGNSQIFPQIWGGF